MTDAHDLNCRGQYFGSYTYSIKSYNEPQKVCVVFPGQGVAFAGMFSEAFERFESFRERFAIADAFAQKYGFAKPSLYIRSPTSIPKEQVHIIQNLCLFVCSLALYDIILKKSKPDIIVGHSFGEFGSLVASGVISFEDMLLLVYVRDLWSPKPFSIGSMIAIRLAADKVRELLEGNDHFIANINSEVQTVISVANEKVVPIIEILKFEGIEYKELAIAQPYHSSLLHEVSDRMSVFLENKKISYHTPKIPFCSSVLTKIIDADNFNDALIDTIIRTQITTPINFKKQVEAIYEKGCRRFIELGPSDVFSSIIRDIVHEPIFSEPIQISSFDEGKEAISKPSSKLINIINRVVGKVTGYEVQHISVEDRFGEDLGIDSIKKTDIIFTVLDEAKVKPDENINISAFRKLNDLVSYVEQRGNQPVEAVEKREEDFERVRLDWRCQELTMLDFSPNRIDVSEMMEISALHIFTESERALEELEHFLNGKPQAIIQITEGTPKSAALGYPIAIEEYSKIIDKFFRSVLSDPERRVTLVLIASGTQTPFFEGLAAFARSLQKEGTIRKVLYLQSDQEIKGKGIVFKELECGTEHHVKYKNGKRYIRVFEKLKVNEHRDRFDLKVIVAIGGAKGICFSLLDQLTMDQTPIIYLIGRSPVNDEISKQIRTLSKKTTVEYIRADGSDHHHMEGIFDSISGKHERIDLVLDAAGIEHSRKFSEKKETDSREEFRNKVAVAQNLLRLNKKYRIGKLIIFGSIVGYFGNEGQSAYASANSITDALVHQCEEKNVSIINWPPWKGIGMTKSKHIQAILKQKSVSLLDSSKAYELFQTELRHTEGDSIFYFDLGDWDSYQSLAFPEQWQWILGSREANSLVREFSLEKDVFLKDHSLKGVAYVPAAMGLIMMLYRLRIHFGFFPVLEDFKIVAPIIVTDSVKTKIKLHMQKDIAHCEISTSHPCWYGKSKGEKQMATRVEIVETNLPIENPYEEGILFHGERFQCLEKCTVNKQKDVLMGKIRADLSLDRGAIWENAVLWADSCFQSLGLLSSYGSSGNCIPVAVWRFSIDATHVPKELFAMAKITNRGEGIIEGDCFVMDERGHSIISMHGVRMQLLRD